ncbi:flavohemoglobin [Suhomyces tanzawaensis NRRL Y-17324]|uniref:nitric oxide dioxygenase n=1 Tax=Suhomyces tanzawaensis NRRL Y-17324 TaxID=984487 RepID=A0A1E4SM13_9ASCO|nr:flavohemoglobin [Suhomyces tanzawaensis NRRL Y-17324]ODV80566.1 flavohemoglobin [Suhomyces tanzawaensis NRRL Y-17324]
MTNTYTVQELTPAQLQIIRDTIPILELSGEALTAKFYSNMLQNNPEVRPFFNPSDQTTHRQPKILAFALLQYAKHIEDLGVLQGFVSQIVSKHVGLQVKAEHYPIVGNNLIATMGELLGPEIATPEFVAAWATAYGNLAAILIGLEKEEYLHNPWDGFRDFIVTRIESECADVKSVYFKPKDPEHKISAPKRGQYVCIRWTVPGISHETSREYSLSEYPKDGHYRISVRLIPDGAVSGYVHHNLKVGDTLKVAPPCGNFVYEEGKKDVVLLVGGIGITPLISILEQALADGRKVKMLYSNRNEKSRAFGEYLESLKAQGLELVEFFSENGHKLQEQDLQFVTSEHDVYLLGPRPYMKFVKDALAKREINDVHLEFFGPVEV